VPKPAYGHEHQKRRAKLLPDAYGTLCPLCGEPMLRGQELELDHSTKLMNDPTSKGDRIVHARCNERDGALAQQAKDRYAPSRDW
jgi:hypothetical protein